jgi:hypothetical protein
MFSIHTQIPFMSHLTEKSYHHPSVIHRNHEIKGTHLAPPTAKYFLLLLPSLCCQKLVFSDNECTGWTWMIHLEGSKVLSTSLLGAGQVTSCTELSFPTHICILVSEPIKYSSV